MHTGLPSTVGLAMLPFSWLLGALLGGLAARLVVARLLYGRGDDMRVGAFVTLTMATYIAFYNIVSLIAFNTVIHSGNYWPVIYSVVSGHGAAIAYWYLKCKRCIPDE